MKYIEAFREGDKISEVYLCKYRQSATAKNGKAYENVVLQDQDRHDRRKNLGSEFIRNSVNLRHWITSLLPVM